MRRSVLVLRSLVRRCLKHEAITREDFWQRHGHSHLVRDNPKNPKNLRIVVIVQQADVGRVLVFEGRFKITQDVVVSASNAAHDAQAGKPVLIEGELRYQVGDKTICYPPQSVPIKRELQVLPLDFKRSPIAIRHTASGEAN
jgi:hypothetical protein